MDEPSKDLAKSDAARLLSIFEKTAAAAERGWALLTPKPKPPTEPIEGHI